VAGQHLPRFNPVDHRGHHSRHVRFRDCKAERNLDDSAARTRLYRLTHRVEIADEPGAGDRLPPGVTLPPKDGPILLAAIAARCTHLVTGDRKHFGPYFGKAIQGVNVMMVRDYLVVRGLI
jgi:uncharacterized protein